MRGPGARHRAVDAWSVEAGRRQAVLPRAVLNESVGDSDVVQAALDPVRRQAFAHRAAGTAGHGVLLERHDAIVRVGQPADVIFVQWLHETHVNQRRVEAPAIAGAS